MAQEFTSMLQCEDFIMKSELNWNVQGYKMSKKMMKNKNNWHTWSEMRQREDFKKMIQDNNKNGEFDAYKADYQAERGIAWLANR
jgi:hypothetical protein